jgi:plastocyanin/cytochrome c556
MRRNHASAIALLTAACLLAAALRSAHARSAAQESDGATLMKELSSDFTALEKAIHERTDEGIATPLAALRDAYPRMRTIKPGVHGDAEEELARHVERFGEILSEIGDVAATHGASGAEQPLDELRATCVSCHLKFRSGNEERGNFPARDNTITGAISLTDADGIVRADRSWVLVFIESVHAGQEPGARTWQRGPVKLSQKLRQFQPRVLPVVVGTTVEFPNDDTIFHNVFSLSKTKPFDLGTYEPGRTATVSMDRTGLVKVYCNIHPDMNASIVVLANPWFALTDRDGRFVICNVPAGEYSLRAWNDLGAETSQKLTLASGADGLFTVPALALKESLRVVRHTNKFGRAYSDKY